MPLINISNEIQKKREALGITTKEFADALGLSKNGEKLLREWEKGTVAPPEQMYKKIITFATDRPFHKTTEEGLFRFIDLFAGIGGIRIPFQELGGSCVFSSEWDQFAQKTYRVNFGETPSGDITQIESASIPDFDILLGGFPCQPFSSAGLKKGFADTRGTMFFEIERIIRDKRPKAFLLENVKQLQTHDKGRTLKVILSHIDKLDYYVKYVVLRAGDFGVPQNRERTYIVGFDKRYYDMSEDYDFQFPVPTCEKTRLGDILESDVDDRYTLTDAIWEGFKKRKQNNINRGAGFGYCLFNEDSPYVSTLVARYYKDGQEILIDQGADKNPRKLTPRECARLQGFPDSFIIPVSNSQAYKQFGNSVAVPVIRAIAKRILEEMNRLTKRSER
jgi:DNA (cytosine-5)-methyltransferase 1